MKNTLGRALQGITLIAVVLTASKLSAQVFQMPRYVTRSELAVTPFNSTGVLLTEVAGEKYRGSAAVARDQRLLYTCAHVLYDDGLWATTGGFARMWDSPVAPTEAELVKIRGFHYYGAYSGGNSPRAFSLDFAVSYRNPTTNFGPALPVLINGGVALRDPLLPKLIVGYPAEYAATGASGRYYMHKTGPFTEPMTQERKSYHLIDMITTGRGNSGGPVVATIEGTPTLVGILVSGSSFSTGVHGLNPAANTIADLVLADLDGIATGRVQTKVAKNSSTTRIPDSSRTYTARSLAISGLGTTAVGTTFSLRIDTPFRGDLDVYIRSPAGRLRWVQKHSLSGAGRNVILDKVDYRSNFYGTNPNGKWQVFMRDFYEDDIAIFRNASVAVQTPQS